MTSPPGGFDFSVARGLSRSVIEISVTVSRVHAFLKWGWKTLNLLFLPELIR
jgi:hypothetical protein